MTEKWQRQDLRPDLSKFSAWNLGLSELKGSLEVIWPRGRLWKHTKLCLHILKTTLPASQDLGRSQQKYMPLKYLAHSK